MSTGKYRAAVTGHAMPEENEDYKLICAGASTLLQGLMYALEKAQTEGNTRYTEVEFRQEPGDSIAKVKPEHWAEPYAKRLRGIRCRDGAAGAELSGMCPYDGGRG